MTAPTALLAAKSALVIAHPGQELSVYGWLELVRPRVHVLTSGAGLQGTPRIAATAQLLERIGAKPGAVFGRLGESDLYARILQSDIAWFRGLASELAESLVAQKAEFVVGQAAEGIHVATDLLHAVTTVAAAEASTRLGRLVSHYEYTALAAVEACPAELRHRSLRLSLYEEAFERKLEAAALYTELADEVRAVIVAAGIDAFRVECFWPATSGRVMPSANRKRPWEERGAALVAAGRYSQAIRFAEHVAPLMAQLQPAASHAA